MIKKSLKVIGAIFAFFIVLAIILPTPPKDDVQKDSTPANDVVVVPEVMEEVPEVVEEEGVAKSKSDASYAVIYTKSKFRSDGASAYWVLIDAVDLSSDAFKSDIENVLKQLVVEKGSKISVSIFDQRSALDLNYKQYGDLSLGRVRTAEESQAQERHLIAMFDGNYKAFNFQYDNELTYFPGAIKSTPVVGQYMGTVEIK